MNHDDRRLIADVIAGNSAAFGELVARYQDRLFNVAYRVLDNTEDAADVVQEVFVNAYQSLRAFKGDSELFTWLYRIAFNTAISFKRRRRRVMRIDGTSDDGGLDPEDRSLDTAPEAQLERTEDERVLAEAMAKLSPEHRTVLVLKDIDGLKYEDIAEVMGVPIGTVRSRLHRARLELKSLLDPDEVGLVDRGGADHDER
ncbi:MAG: sigma-70 family RNA polymerase sigma factor [Fimbriiglobus sp.]|nr:sigma-70 family RNA polymerase sigma factor [Fimbriiglobus sp.]